MLELMTATTTIFFITLACAYAWRWSTTTNRGRQLPPGPPGIVLANLLQGRSTLLATYFRGMFEKYGGLVSLNAVGLSLDDNYQPLILIGDLKLAKDMLDKHSAKHSSRPIMPYVRHHFNPTDAYWGAAEDNATNTLGRKLSARVMSTVRAGKTEPLQEFEALQNIQHLLNDGGEHWFRHIERVIASSTLAAAFGMHCPTGHELALKEILGVVTEAAEQLRLLTSVVNFFPFLDLIPGPMPWRRRAREFHERENAVYNKLVDEALTGKASGMNTWAAVFASEDKPEGDQRHLLNHLIVGSIESTTVSLRIFVLACIRYPDWIATAQREIDLVVGPERLPGFKDRPFLPYVEAVVRETLRWRPAIRAGLPHKSTADDIIEYQGKEYFIPKGSMIFAVPWAIDHDQSRFEDPDRFNPARFLDGEGQLKPDYNTSGFGFGRRVCPGIPFATESMWINIATMLWTFNIRGSSELDFKTGLPFKYDDSDIAFTGDLTISPVRFPAVFEPRSPERVEVARCEWAECEKDLNILLPALEE